MCVRGWAVKEVGDQDLTFSGCSLLPGSVWPMDMPGVRGMVVKSGRDLIATEFSPFHQVWSLTHAVPAAEQVELGFLIKLHLSFP